MRINTALLIALCATATQATAGGDIVLPPQEGGFVQRGATTDSVSFNIPMPDVSLYNDYDSDLGISGNPRIEVPINVPQFDGSLGDLVAINITMDGFLESMIGVEAVGILNINLPHEAGFNSIDTLFGDTAGYPVIGLLQRPSNDPRGIAPNFYPIGSIGAYCDGFPGDEDSCGYEEWYDRPGGNTVDVFIFEDQNGPIYTLSDWIGAGFVPNFTLFIDNPNNTALGDQYEFYVDNVAGATGWIETQIYSASMVIEYVYEIDQPDTDGDGVIDVLDNCTLKSNPSQVDTNGDNYGNACDPDVNNDGIVNATDLGLFRAAFFSTGVNDTDMNADGITNAIDLGVLREFFFGPPGPSGLVP